MEKHVLVIYDLLDAQVCSAGTYDEALEFLREAHPAGTEHNWQKNAVSKFAPLPCERYPARNHYMFKC